MIITEEMIKKYSGLSAKDLVDLGICPTCFNRASNGAVFGNDEDKRVFEDKDIECMFVGNPRAEGHMMVITKTHYHDMAECPEEINEKVFRFCKALMIIIKEVFQCERVYLCTMADGPMNHFHVQLIPRYSYEERGSKNFVKPRKEYVFNKEKFNLVKQKLEDYNKSCGEKNG